MLMYQATGTGRASASVRKQGFSSAQSTSRASDSKKPGRRARSGTWPSTSCGSAVSRPPSSTTASYTEA